MIAFSSLFRHRVAATAFITTATATTAALARSTHPAVAHLSSVVSSVVQTKRATRQHLAPQLLLQQSFYSTSAIMSSPDRPVQTLMEQALRQFPSLQPVQYLEMRNESHKHKRPGAESHFKVIVVSSAFEDMSLIERHRIVNAACAEFMRDGQPVHALSIVAKTPQEWQDMLDNNEKVPPSPNCQGGGD